MTALLTHVRRDPETEQTAWWPRHARMSAGQSLLTMALGVLLISIAYAEGRTGSNGTVWVAVYWIGQVVVFSPVVLRAVSRSGPCATEGAILVLGLATATYLAKYLYSPLGFRFPDELEHWRSTANLLESSHLFGANHLLPISPEYPGLEEITGALASTTGMSIFAAGLIVAWVAHLLFVSALYVVFARVSKSPRIAIMACVIYATNPHFQVFDAIFGYQTLALAFLGMALVAVLRADEVADRTEGLVWRLLSIGMVLATVITHHVTSYVLTGTLFLLAATAILRARRRGVPAIARSADGRVLLLALLSACATAVWVLAVAPITFSYLAPTFRNFLSGLGGVITVQPSTHDAIPSGPLLDQLFNYASAALVTIGLPFGWRHIWRTQRQNTWAVALACGSTCYYVITLLRLTMPDGAEFAGRALTYLYIPIAYTLAMAVASRLRNGIGAENPPPTPINLQNKTLIRLAQVTRRTVDRLPRVRSAAAIAIGTAVLLCGGIAAGWPAYWERLPGRYVVDGFESGITPESTAAAIWAKTSLGKDNRISGDFTNYILLGSYGDQDVVNGVNQVYNSPEYSPATAALAREHAVRYVAVDLRTSRYLPPTGGYFPDQSPGDITPIPKANLLKFDNVPGADRVYDSGNIIIYELPVNYHAP